MTFKGLTGAALFARLKTRTAEGLSGLDVAEAQARAETMKTSEVLPIYRSERERAEGWRTGAEAAQAADQADRLALARAAVDQGRPVPPDPRVAGPKALAFVKEMQSHAAEYGLSVASDGTAPDVGHAIAARLQMLARLLAKRYEVEGPPPELTELRGRIARAVAASWQANAVIADERKAFNRGGGSSAAMSENAILEAVKVAGEASRTVEALKAELRARFGVEK